MLTLDERLQMRMGRIISGRWMAAAVCCAGLGLIGAITGCTRSTSASESSSSLAADQRAINEARQQMELIPPPSKTRYMAVRSLTLWENPYVTVQGGMVTIHVVTADANKTSLGMGGMLRPMGARRQDLNVRLAELPSALNAVPENSWPYGRVVAIEEAHDVPAGARPEMRRNMESVMKTLNDLGVVVYEWNDATAGK
jgi:hypothetical protein